MCQWLFDTVAGIRAAGENHFVLAPTPGGGLTHARASYLSPYGRVESRWERTGQTVTYTITIPANCTAEVCLPDGTTQNVAAGEHSFTV